MEEAAVGPAGVPESFGVAKQLENPVIPEHTLIASLPEDVPLPECSIEPDGCVSLDWMRGPNRTFTVSVGEWDRIPYAWVDGTDRGHAVARLVDGQLPPRILAEIRRFTSHDTSLRAA